MFRFQFAASPHAGYHLDRGHITERRSRSGTGEMSTGDSSLSSPVGATDAGRRITDPLDFLY